MGGTYGRHVKRVRVQRRLAYMHARENLGLTAEHQRRGGKTPLFPIFPWPGRAGTALHHLPSCVKLARQSQFYRYAAGNKRKPPGGSGGRCGGGVWSLCVGVKLRAPLLEGLCFGHSRFVCDGGGVDVVEGHVVVTF
jgi:hypothetical protein